MHTTILHFALTAAIGAAGSTTPNIRITEYMYSGSGGEFFEIINLGDTPVDFTGWSYDDDRRMPGGFDLGAIGILMPCEIAIVTEDPAEVFRADWSLPADLKIIGDLGLPNANTLGRNDSIVLYKADGSVADQLDYGDQAFPGTIRTQNISGWVDATELGANNIFAWVLSVAGDEQGSATSFLGALGNPGTFNFDASDLSAGLGMVITEYMYTGPGGEFIEFTNVSDASIDMTGWAFDDNNFGTAYIQPFDLSAFGVVAPGESVILTESEAEAFRTAWGLGADVKIIGDLGLADGRNLGRNDEINIYDQNDELVDRLTYGDQAFPGSIRTQNFSGWTIDGIGQNDALAWILASVGDAQNSYASANGDIGNPGIFKSSLCDKKPGIPGDLNDDGVVDGADLGILLNAWGDCPVLENCVGDLNGDGVVDGADLGILLNNWS